MSVERAVSRATAPRPLVVDESRHPFVQVTMIGVASDAEFDEFLAAFDRVLRRLKPYVMAIDACHAGPATAHRLKAQVAWLQSHLEPMRAHCLGLSFATASPIVRGALTSILWMQPLPHPYLVTASPAEAERWALERLTAAGLRVPTARAVLAR